MNSRLDENRQSMQSSAAIMRSNIGHTTGGKYSSIGRDATDSSIDLISQSDATGWVEKKDVRKNVLRKMFIKKDEEIDPRDLILEHNPGDMIRNKAIGVDLSDFEQLKVELESDYERQVKYLKSVVKAHNKSTSKDQFQSSNTEKLMTMTELMKKKNSNIISSNLLKEQTIRNLDRNAQKDGKNGTEREYDNNKE